MLQQQQQQVSWKQQPATMLQQPALNCERLEPIAFLYHDCFDDAYHTFGHKPNPHYTCRRTALLSTTTPQKVTEASFGTAFELLSQYIASLLPTAPRARKASEPLQWPTATL
jgi:hypothetical protein